MKQDKGVNILVNCNESGEEGSFAFRAVSSEPQNIEEVDTFYKVLFQREQFDFGDIYNTNTSTFVPSEEGVYYVSGTVTFLVVMPDIPFRVRLEIRVNGESVAADNDYFGHIPFRQIRLNTIQTSTILNLQAGDLVEIFFTSTIPGQIETDFPSNGLSTHFEAARY